MHDTGNGSPVDRIDPVSDLLTKMLEAPTAEQAPTLEALCAMHPECAAALREAWGTLQQLDLAQVAHSETTANATPPDANGLPRLLGPFRLLEFLGAGGMGAVYRAEDVELKRLVALKLIRSDLVASERARTRFQRESAALARLDHPGLCTAYRAGTTDGQPWIAMRLVRGTTLAQHIAARLTAMAATVGSQAAQRRCSLPSRHDVQQIVAWFENVARALATAHAVGVVHRDLKPGNIVLTADDEPVVIDFGLVHLDDADSHLTISGDQVGTPAYMAPEQVQSNGHDVAPTTDVYSLGVTMFEALALALPYPAKAREELFTCIARGRRLRLRQVAKELPADLEFVLEKALELEPARRYASMIEFAEDLRRFRVHEPLVAGPPSTWYRLRKLLRRYPGRIAAGAAVFATAAVGAVVALQFALREQAKVREFDQLKVVVLYERTIALEKDLYPALPHKIAAMEAWLHNDCGNLLAMRPEIEQTVHNLRARALPAPAKQIEADRRSHPRFAEYEAATRQAASLRYAQAIRAGQQLVEPPLNAEQQAMDARALNAFAWERVAPKVEERRVWNEETLGLAAARLAATKAKGTPTEFQVLATLAWALVANGQDGPAKQASEQAYDLAPEEQAASYEQFVRDVTGAAEQAIASLAAAEAKIVGLGAFVGERQTWSFAPAEESQGFLHDALVDLQGKLSSLARNEKTAVEQRLMWAKQIRELTLTHPNARRTWTAVRAAIAGNPKYAGQSIELWDEDVLGLVPIGENPITNLWEFYDLRSAWDGKQDPRSLAIPQHEDDGSIRVTSDTGIVFVLLPGGTFWMGAQKDEPKEPNFDPDARNDERPVHQVTLAAFFLARHELTRGQWQRLTWMRPFWWNEGRVYDGDRIAIGGTHPADSIDWDEANRWMERHGLLLPTEAQWEYGCRAGTSTPWWPGAAVGDLRGCANVHDQTSVPWQPGWGVPAPFADGFIGIAPVGSFRANAFGLFDVHGNVYEWCSDWSGEYESAVRVGDGYRMVGSSANRVFRGGCYVSVQVRPRSASRNQHTPSFRNNNLGLRPSRALRPLE